MSRIFLFLAVVVAFVGMGCTTVKVDSRVTIGPNLDPDDVPISRVTCIRQENGYYVFQMDVKNNTTDELPLEWKVQWLNANGIEIESIVSTWQKITLAPYETRGLRNQAASTDAVDARAYFRKMK